MGFPSGGLCENGHRNPAGNPATFVIEPQVRSAAARLAHRCNLAEQILADLAAMDKMTPVESFNDDDLYEFDADTLELIKQHSPSRDDLAYLLKFTSTAMLCNGNMLARGMRAKYLGLWRAA